MGARPIKWTPPREPTSKKSATGVKKSATLSLACLGVACLCGKLEMGARRWVWVRTGGIQALTPL